MLKIILTGNVGKDCERRSFEGGKDKVSFSVGVSAGKDKTTWVECVVTNEKQQEIAMNYIKKGMKILIEGMPTTNAYIDKENKAVGKMTVYVNNMEFLSKVEQDNSPNHTLPPKSDGGYPNNDNDIPF